MPELPEVETVVRTLAPHLTGRRIQHVHGVDVPVTGRVIERLSRHGKYIVLHLDDGLLLIHLRMTGKLLFNGTPTPHTRASFGLDNGTLLFDDIRRFGRITWSPGALPDQGPDPLEIPSSDFVDAVHARRGSIKPLLLNQRFLRGLGNIYVDEALHRAKIHPLAQAARLSRPRLVLLHQTIIEVLREAIEAGGSSISDYVDAEGRAGSFQGRHRAYGRAGEPCFDCGNPICRIVVGQRGTHFCQRCQKR